MTLFVLAGLFGFDRAVHKTASVSSENVPDRLLEAFTFGTQEERIEARNVLREKSANVVPCLMTFLRRCDESAAHRRLRMWIQNSQLRYRYLGHWISAPPIHRWQEYAAVRALGEIGPPASSATPLLKRLSHPQAFGIPAEAALMKIRRQSIEPNIKSLQNLGSPDRRHTAELLGEFGTNAAKAVRPLCEGIKEGDNDDALVAATALGGDPRLSPPSRFPP